MGPHGGSFAGSSHSHSEQYPDDSWNLYCMLDTCTGYNVTRNEDAIGIFKPHARRLEQDPHVVSAADEEVLILVRFTSPVHIRKLMVIGGGAHEQHPAKLKCYVNQEMIDFMSLQGMTAVQEFNLAINELGTTELVTAASRFNNISSLAFYFPSNHGGSSSTSIQYIGMQGEHTHYRRQPVDAVYELLCTGNETVDGVVDEHSHEHVAHSHSHDHSHDHSHYH